MAESKKCGTNNKDIDGESFATNLDEHYKIDEKLIERVKKQEKKIRKEVETEKIKTGDTNKLIEKVNSMGESIDEFMNGELSFKEATEIININMSYLGDILGQNFNILDKKKVVESFTNLNDKMLKTINILKKDESTNLNKHMFILTLKVVLSTFNELNSTMIDINEHVKQAYDNMKIPDIDL
jgi:hypothetical protein